jgi:hypothetical protein
MSKYLKLILLFSTYILLNCTNPHPVKMIMRQHMDSSPADAFKVWHYIHKREYPIQSEEGFKRYHIFKNNFEMVNSHNESAEKSYTMSMNDFADMSVEEFHDKFLSGNLEMFESLKNKYKSSELPKLNFWDLPEDRDEEYFELYLSGKNKENSLNFLSTEHTDHVEFDSVNWVDKGMLKDHVEDQGNCGSCWAFATTQSMEAAFAIKNGKSIKLSKQQLIDCETHSKGCKGGLLHTVMEYAKEKGIELSNDYPYMMRNDICSYSDKKVALKIASWEGCDEESCATDTNLYKALKSGPVAAVVDAGKEFMLYDEGIYDKPCKKMSHAVLVVGYHKKEIEDDQSYWLVKNSWGFLWGDHGYIKIKHGKDYNNCLLHKYFTRPNI